MICRVGQWFAGKGYLPKFDGILFGVVSRGNQREILVWGLSGGA